MMGRGRGRQDDDDDNESDHHDSSRWPSLRNTLARYLNRTVPPQEKSGAAARHFGPFTSVPLLGWSDIMGTHCGCMVFVPIVTMLVFLADVTLAIIAGLDMVDRGPQTPYIQFSIAIAIAVLYMALCVMALTQYFWERVLNYRYHTVWALCLAALLAWINFGVWASWISKFHGSADNVDSADTIPFVAWVATNAVGLAGFFARLVVFSVGIALRYTHDRAMEPQSLIAQNLAGGKSIGEIISGGNRILPYRGIGMRTPRYSNDDSDDSDGGANADMLMESGESIIAHRDAMWSGTDFARQQQQERMIMIEANARRHGKSRGRGRYRRRAPMAATSPLATPNPYQQHI